MVLLMIKCLVGMGKLVYKSSTSLVTMYHNINLHYAQDENTSMKNKRLTSLFMMVDQPSLNDQLTIIVPLRQKKKLEKGIRHFYFLVH